ncbi:MAG: response regulator [Candidatus Omnitrophota bacterium]
MTSKIKILIAEDDNDLRHSLADLLIEEGYDIIEVAEAGKILDVVTREKPNVLILDISLPDGDCYEICRKIKEIQGAGIRIILYSGYIDYEKAKVAGADECLLKGCDVLELMKTIKA